VRVCFAFGHFGNIFGLKKHLINVFLIFFNGFNVLI